MMPGVNCSVLGCGSCRRSKGIGIFKLPVAKDEAHRKWRNDWLGVVTKAREIDQDFREQIKNDKVHACEKHFKPEDIELCKYRFIFCQTVEICFQPFTTRNHNRTGRVVEFVRCFEIAVVAAGCSAYISCLFSNRSIFLVHSAKMTKKKLRFGALPTVNMPHRSHDSNPAEPRPAQTVVRDIEPESRSSCYTSFIEFCECTKSLKSIGDWCVKLLEDRKVFKKMVEPYLLPEVEIIVDDSLGFTVKVFGSYMVDDHPLYLKYCRTMCNVTLSNLVKDLENLKLCTGVNPIELTSKLFHHVVPVNHDCMGEEEEPQQFPHKGFWRVKECLLFNKADGICPACQEFNVHIGKAKESRSIKPAHVNMARRL